MKLGRGGYPKNAGGGSGGGKGGLNAGRRSEEKLVSLRSRNSSSTGDEAESASDLRSTMWSSSFACSSTTLNIHTYAIY